MNLLHFIFYTISYFIFVPCITKYIHLQFKFYTGNKKRNDQSKTLQSDTIVVGRCEMVWSVDASCNKAIHFLQLYYNTLLSNSLWRMINFWNSVVNWGPRDEETRMHSSTCRYKNLLNCKEKDLWYMYSYAKTYKVPVSMHTHTDRS